MTDEVSAPSFVEPQFGDLRQQSETATLGMWAFLVSEVMFFGSLLATYTIYRLAYPGAFFAASRHTNVLLGTLNTAVLLTSSLFMVFAVTAARDGKHKAAAGWLVVTALAGTAFLGIKGFEYHEDWQEHLVPGTGFSMDTRDIANNGIVIADRFGDGRMRTGSIATKGELPSEIPGAVTAELTPPARNRVQMFFLLYFFLTGLHALHLTIGIGWAGVTTFLAWKDKLLTGHPVETLGLYWHFVDIVWLFLYPLFYLAGRGGT